MNDPQTSSPSSCRRKAEITYPCQWLYKVIGKDQESVRKAIISSCDPLPVEISLSHSSSRGSYRSFNAEVVVENEAIRLAIYHSLTNHPAVKLVL